MGSLEPDDVQPSSVHVDGSWLAYPTLSHGNAGMVKVAGSHAHRAETVEVLRRFGPLVLAEFRVEQDGPYAGAVRVCVGNAVIGSIPSSLGDDYRHAVTTLAHEGIRATIHAEIQIEQYVDVWGLCQPQPRREAEPLLPTQYREDIRLLEGVAEDLDQSLRSRAKEKKVRRNGTLSLGDDGVWSVALAGRTIGTLDKEPYVRLHEVVRAGLPLDAVVTIHRRPARDLVVHVSIPPDPLDPVSYDDEPSNVQSTRSEIRVVIDGRSARGLANDM
jgi:hypothetical protein